MLQFGQNRPIPPRSNTERQRNFRKRHPGYYGRLHRQRNGQTRVTLVANVAAPALPARAPLMLPTPVEQMVFADRATIPTLAELHHPRDAVLVEPAAR